MATAGNRYRPSKTAEAKDRRRAGSLPKPHVAAKRIGGGMVDDLLFQPLNSQAGGRLQQVVRLRTTGETAKRHDVAISLQRINVHL